MAKTVSRTLSVHQEHEFLGKLEAAGLTSDLAQRVIDSRGNKFAKRIVEVINGDGKEGDKPGEERQTPSSPNQSTFPLTLDYSQSLPTMIAAGGYDWVNSDITAEHFPITGEGQIEVEVTLFHFNRSMSSEPVLEELDQAGFRPAKIEELVALGVKERDLQKKFPIVALGSVWRGSDGRRYVPDLDWSGRGRSLGLLWLGDEWVGSCRFAAVRQ